MCSGVNCFRLLVYFGCTGVSGNVLSDCDRGYIWCGKKRWSAVCLLA